jgi:hypothetical protein
MDRQGIDNNTFIRPRPTKLSGVALIIAGVIFLPFSALPFSNSGGDGESFIFIFGIIWVTICLSFIIYGVYILVSNKPSTGIVYDLESNTTLKNPNFHDDFATRLRNLEKLKQDRLITEEEYKSKRVEIMKESW